MISHFWVSFRTERSLSLLFPHFLYVPQLIFKDYFLQYLHPNFWTWLPFLVNHFLLFNNLSLREGCSYINPAIFSLCPPPCSIICWNSFPLFSFGGTILNSVFLGFSPEIGQESLSISVAAIFLSPSHQKNLASSPYRPSKPYQIEY